jgi:hypothetical protein
MYRGESRTLIAGKMMLAKGPGICTSSGMIGSLLTQQVLNTWAPYWDLWSWPRFQVGLWASERQALRVDPNRNRWTEKRRSNFALSLRYLHRWWWGAASHPYWPLLVEFLEPSMLLGLLSFKTSSSSSRYQSKSVTEEASIQFRLIASIFASLVVRCSLASVLAVTCCFFGAQHASWALELQDIKFFEVV